MTDQKQHRISPLSPRRLALWRLSQDCYGAISAWLSFSLRHKLTGKMNTKGIICAPICMLNAGEGTFCNAGVRVMLQLNPTLSLRDWANTIVLLLCVYPFAFAISACLHSSMPRSPVSSFSLWLYLHSMSSFHLRQTKCSIAFPSVVMKWEGTRRGVTRERKRKRKKRGITVTDNSALKQWHCSHTFSRWTGSCCFVLTLTSSSLCFHLSIFQT